LETEKWNPFSRLINPAGLKYTASIDVEAFLAGRRTQVALWLVLVTRPPAKRLPVMSVAVTRIKNFLIGYSLSLKFYGDFAPYKLSVHHSPVYLTFFPSY
jgi:hypothetical protein